MRTATAWAYNYASGSIWPPLFIYSIYQVYTMKTINFNTMYIGEFGIVYKGFLVHQHIDEIVAIKTAKGNCKLILLQIQC